MIVPTTAIVFASESRSSCVVEPVPGCSDNDGAEHTHTSGFGHRCDTSVNRTHHTCNQQNAEEDGKQPVSVLSLLELFQGTCHLCDLGGRRRQRRIKVAADENVGLT